MDFIPTVQLDLLQSSLDKLLHLFTMSQNQRLDSSSNQYLYLRTVYIKTRLTYLTETVQPTWVCDPIVYASSQSCQSHPPSLIQEYNEDAVHQQYQYIIRPQQPSFVARGRTNPSVSNLDSILGRQSQVTEKAKYQTLTVSLTFPFSHQIELIKVEQVRKPHYLT